MWKKTPEVIASIEKLLEHDRAGCPATGLQWTRRTTSKVSAELAGLGICVSPNTVGRILRELGFALRANHKKLSSRSDPERKELIGNFRNPGTAWSREPQLVNDHDFRSDALALAVPYGIYDVLANRGTLYVGTSADTPAFAVANPERWWQEEGEARYPYATELLILADGAGSNGYRVRAFKYRPQEALCDRHCLVVTVAHYPAAASKWNPIEHRLFSEISKNWAARPLDSFETLLAYARSTRTRTGLHVEAHLSKDHAYPTGERASKAQMRELDIEPHPDLPKRTTPSIPGSDPCSRPEPTR